MARQIPNQLAVFDDPAAAMRAASKDLAHVESRPWGALATTPSSGGQWTVAAFLGPEGRSARVARSHAERSWLGHAAGDFPIALLVGLGCAGLGGVLMPGFGFIPAGMIGVLLGLPVASLWRRGEGDRTPAVELSDEMRLVVRWESDALASSELVGALLKVVVAGADRSMVARIVLAADAVLQRRMPADLGVAASVERLLFDYVKDPRRRHQPTLEALTDLDRGCAEWLAARLRLEAAADAPVRTARARQRAADDAALRDRAKAHVDGVLGQLKLETRTQESAADDL